MNRYEKAGLHVSPEVVRERNANLQEQMWSAFVAVMGAEFRQGPEGPEVSLGIIGQPESSQTDGVKEAQND